MTRQKKSNKSPNKSSVKEIMERIIDKDDLTRRKENQKISVEENNSSTEASKPYKPQVWYKQEITENDFEKVLYKGKYYVRHKKWSKGIFFYSNKEEEKCDLAIKKYVNECKKPLLDRRLDFVQSIYIEDVS